MTKRTFNRTPKLLKRFCAQHVLGMKMKTVLHSSKIV
jgi:hypothetical protein